MKALEEIKARAQVNLYIGKTASQSEARDTLKLIAAMEAVEDLCEQDLMLSPEQVREAIAEALA